MNKLNSLFNYFLTSSRFLKRSISVGYDMVAIVSCVVLSLLASDRPLLIWNVNLVVATLITLIGALITYVNIGYYRAILRYMGFQSVFTITFGITVTTLIFKASTLLVDLNISPLTLLLFWTFSLVSIGGVRLFVIAIIRSKLSKFRKNVAIYGAGHSARQLVKALHQGQDFKVVAHIDDNPAMYMSEIDGVKIYSPASIQRLVDLHNIGEIFLAMPGVSHARRAEILNGLEMFPVKVRTIASLEEIVSGKVQIEQLKDIELEDLLGRDSVEPDVSLMNSGITNKVVLVTGAGGSIGAELCRQIVRLKPSKLVLYELSEFALYSIEKELRKIATKQSLVMEIIPLLGSIQHKNRMVRILRRYRVETVYHAAAYKHVPIVEHNIVEGVRNNVFGTWYAAEAAAEAGVGRFVLVSTDKAVRPTNVMGASKRFAELILQAINARGTNTIFSMVRFGNVLGSSGSVVPLFREQIKTGGPVTVTHKDITRYFMTIPEAAQLVIQAGAMGKGGDVFVLDMGDQVKISELAERMIHLLGLTVKNDKNPQGEIAINYSGLRPGEKLFEELLIGENLAGTTHSKIMTADEEMLPWNDMQKALILMNELCEDMDCDGIVQLLLKVPTGYNPQHAVCDLLWDEDRDRNNVVRFKTLV